MTPLTPVSPGVWQQSVVSGCDSHIYSSELVASVTLTGPAVCSWPEPATPAAVDAGMLFPKERRSLHVSKGINRIRSPTLNPFLFHQPNGLQTNES